MTTIIRDANRATAAGVSPALAIDMLWPRNRLLVDNLKIVWSATGGDFHPGTPVSACGRNVDHAPIRDQVEQLSATLPAFERDVD